LSAAIGAKSISSYLSKFIDNFTILESNAEIISLLLVTFFIAFFAIIIGELIPKQLAYIFSEKLALLFSGFIMIFIYLLKPITILLDKIVSLFFRVFNIKEVKESYISKNEILDIISKSDELNYKERDIIKDIIQIKNKRIDSIMIPRVLVDFLTFNLTVAEARVIIDKSKHSRYPVFDLDQDQVLGYVHSFEIFSYNNNNKYIHEIMRNILFYPNSNNIFNVLDNMRSNNMQISVIIDEFGGTDGIVTMEDIIEYIIGDINDEFDEIKIIDKLSSKSILLDGISKVVDVNKEFKINLPEGPYDTVGGLTMHKLGRIPVVGDTISYDSFKIIINKMDKRRVNEIEIIIF